MEGGQVKRIVYIFENGIDTVPGDAQGWQARAIRWFAIQAGSFGIAVEYFSGPLLSRVLGQKSRARELAAVISEFIAAGWVVIIVAHSNGADVVRDTLKSLGWPPILAVHLFSAAIPADMKDDGNGFDAALAAGKIDRMRIYVAGEDKALKYGGMFGKWLGYGKLGRKGPMNMSPQAAARVAIVPREEFGHSSWFEPGENFEWSMNQIRNA
jgi:hypothetical protein